MKRLSLCTGARSLSSHILHIFSAFLVFAAMSLGVSLFGNQAQAQDSPWEISVGGGYGGQLDGEWAHDSYPTHFDHGFTLMASAGYRFTDWFSLNLEQSIIRGYNRDDIDHFNADYGGDESYDSWTLGETAVTVKFIYTNDAKNIDLYLKLGAGMYYGTMYNNHDINDDNYGREGHGIQWSIPMGIGANFYFTDHLGIGFDAQYDMVFIYGHLKTTAHLAMRF